LAATNHQNFTHNFAMIGIKKAAPALSNRHGSIAHQTFLTAGIVHELSMIDGFVSLGQYSRIIRMKSPAGAGSQFDSLSLPGDSR
jgi:hypothetical protein